MEAREQMNIVIVGHVDHGKSTVIGRLLADTGSLPEGKLESVKEFCRKNARPFEYAFLLDALKDEQAQGITIDTARCFFKTNKRDYIIIDAPGHVEFLKNMVTERPGRKPPFGNRREGRYKGKFQTPRTYCFHAGNQTSGCFGEQNGFGGL